MLAVAVGPVTSPDYSAVIMPIVVALLSGGIIQALVAYFRYRTDKGRAPADRDSVVVSSAEKAVISLEKALAAQEKDNVELRAEVVQMRADRVEQREQLLDLEAQLAKCRRDHRSTQRSK